MTHEALEIAESPEAAANACAAWILEEVRNVVSAAGRARIAISGGSTPNAMFDTLGRTPFDWSNVHIFWVDERCVPPTDSRSNFKAASERFLQPASVAAPNIHRIQGELPPAESAEHEKAASHEKTAKKDAAKAGKSDGKTSNDAKH
jgi:6-phosphogluconolactonase